MATEEDIVLRVKAENSEAIKRLAEQRVLVDQLRNSNKGLEAENKTLQKSMNDLAKQGKSNTDEYKEYSNKIKDNTVTITANNEAIKAANKEMTNQSRAIQNNIKFQKENTDSVQAMRAQLSMMKAEYYAMSKAERESADGGVALQKQIKELNDDIGKAEQSIGVFGRNVGNYEGAINSAIGANKGFLGQLTAMQNQAKTTGQSFGTVLVQGIKAVGSAFKALLANPIVLTLAAIVGVITALTKAIKGNEEQSRKLQVLMAPLTRAMEAFKAVLQGVADGLIAVMGWLSKMAGGVSKALEKLPFVGKYIAQANEATEAAIQLEKDKQALQDAERNNQLEQAKTAEKVSELRAKIAQKDKYSAEERIKMINEAADAEKKQADENIRLAEEKLRIAQVEASYSKNSKDANEELIRLEAEVINQRTRMNDQIRALEKQRQTAITQIAAEQKAADDERLKREQDYQKTVEDGRKKIRDLTLELMAEGQDKEIALREKQYQDELANIQGTEAQKKEIRALLEEKYNRDLQAIREKYSAEALDKATEQKAKELEIMLELARGNADKELEIKLQQLDMERQAAIQAAEETGVAVELVEQQFAQRKADLEAEAEEARKEAQAEKLQEYFDGIAEKYAQELEGVEENEQAKADLQLQIEQDKLNRLLEITEENKAAMFDSEEAYQQAVRDQIKQTDKLRDKSEEIARETAENNAKVLKDSLKNMANSMLDLFNEMAGDSEEMQAFLKAVALVQIGIDTAKGIAGAVAGAMEQPFPLNLAAIASGIAAVTAGIIQAKKTLSQQGKVQTPQFATGGLVEGAGTGTSDSISARLSNGESVINARSTAMFAPLLSSINQAGGGVPIQMEGAASQAMGSDYMAESLAQAMRNLPNPVVSVQEITTVNNRVSVLETLANR
ncbi:MAG: hypothetical protein HDT28_05030 [Clostridiales bacterium]|nr:hypothetical protein [Clostridiales bacterium]